MYLRFLKSGRPWLRQKKKKKLKVKCMRSDNGREFIDGGFNEYCVAYGIRMEKTITGTP